MDGEAPPLMSKIASAMSGIASVRMSSTAGLAFYSCLKPRHSSAPCLAPAIGPPPKRFQQFAEPLGNHPSSRP